MIGVRRLVGTVRWAATALAIRSSLVAFQVAGQQRGPEHGEIRPAHRDWGEDWDETPTGRVTRYARSNYVWPYVTGPYYGDATKTSVHPNAPVLRTPVGAFRLTEGSPELPAELKSVNRLDRHAFQYLIVQVDTVELPAGAFEEVREIVEGRGGAVIGKVPEAALVVRLTQAGHRAPGGITTRVTVTADSVDSDPSDNVAVEATLVMR